MKKNKKMIIEILIVIVYFFRQTIFYINPEKGYTIVGNIDIFYLLGFIYIIKNIKKIDKKIIIGIAIFVFYEILQMIYITDVNNTKILINMSKIILCYFVMFFVNENIKKINLKNICIMFSVLCLIFLIISFIFQDSILWRHNDTINKYDLTRLQFLYTEPGELGMHCVIIMIILFTNTLEEKNIKNIGLNILFMIPIIITIYFTKSMGSIGVGIITCIFIIFYDWINNHSKTKNIIYGIMTLIGIILIVLIYTNSTVGSISLRIQDTLKGKDSSNNYRIIIPLKVTQQSLIDSYGLGLGLGNAELEKNIEKYAYLGLEKAGIINSFMNFISEGGILAIIIISIIIYKLLKTSINEKSNINIALAIFIILYQFMGTYFTNPLCWIVYGIILGNNLNEK